MVGCDGVSWRTGQESEGPLGTRGEGGVAYQGFFRQGTEALKAGVMEAKRTHLGAAQDPPCQTRLREGRGS